LTGPISAQSFVRFQQASAIVASIIFSTASKSLAILLLAIHSVRSLTKWLFDLENNEAHLNEAHLQASLKAS
jgi:hypothetical protein